MLKYVGLFMGKDEYISVEKLAEEMLDVVDTRS